MHANRSAVMWILSAVCMLYLVTGTAQISMIGPATPANDWSTDVELTQDTANPAKWTTTVFLSVEDLKFRGNGTWAINWGGNDFPSGAAIWHGPNIHVLQRGVYFVEIDTSALFYNFTYLGAGNVGIGTDEPDPSALLDINSIKHGILLPRMTRYQRDLITNPAPGLIVYNTETDCLNYYSGVNWLVLCGECDSLSTPATAGAGGMHLLDSIQLNGSVLGQYEYGTWTVVSGPGGTFTEASDPYTFFHPTYVGTHTLRWTIDNTCLFDSADVVFEVFDAIYVDVNFGGTPLGTRAAPFTSITSAINAAVIAGQDTAIVVAGGFYHESLAPAGISFSLDLYGGYDPSDWQRDLAIQTSQIEGAMMTVQLTNCSDMYFSGFLITSLNAVLAATSSYGVIALSSTVQFDSCTISAGAGADGENGSTGSAGTMGANGDNGDPGCEYSTSFGCDECSPAPQGGAGAIGAGQNGGTGGNPGLGPNSGMTGLPGAGNPGSGGIGVSSGNGNTAPPSSAHGDPGSPGDLGTGGNGGGQLGTYTTSYIATNNGTSGQSGGPGEGGGGGGGGGGGIDFCDSYGSGGGGGGSGGSGGGGGTAGQGGGGSFGLYAHNSDIMVSNSTIETSSGGDGGDGGMGGSGGPGGSGGLSVYGTAGSQDDGSLGGNGGAGGQGGQGGQGGGGGGGPSIGIVIGVGTTINVVNVIYNIGSGGSGGDGQFPNGDGASGLSFNTY